MILLMLYLIAFVSLMLYFYYKGYWTGYCRGFDCSKVFPDHPARDEYGAAINCPRNDVELKEIRRNMERCVLLNETDRWEMIDECFYQLSRIRPFTETEVDLMEKMILEQQRKK